MILASFLGLFTLLIVLGFLAVKRGRDSREDYLLAGRNLGPIQLALSAAATGNSGFIMLGAVGLGYAFGLTWVFLPLSWLLGDLVFWYLFPEKMNRIAAEQRAATLPELLCPNSLAGWRVGRGFLAILLIAVTGTYGASQVLAGSKALGAVFGTSTLVGAGCTVLAVGLYSIWGGFRASVWTDLVQAGLMLVVTLGSLTLVLSQVGPGVALASSVPGTHFQPFRGIPGVLVLGFVASWACAGLGFGLSQPQVAARFFAGRNGETVRRAKWFYIGFLQFTWAGMTTFGVLVRGVVADIDDPEVALLLFSQEALPPILVGLVVAGIFSAIASTLDSVVLAVGAIVSSDLIPAFTGKEPSPRRWLHILASAITLALVFGLGVASSLNVFELSVFPVELVAVTVGPLVAFRVLFGPTPIGRQLISVVLGIIGVVSWKIAELNSLVSPAIIGPLIFAFLILIRRISSK